MTEPGLFDRFAGEYGDVVNAAIAASGETVDFFAELRAQLVRRDLGATRPVSILDFGCGVGRSTRALADAFPAAAVTGFDPSRGSIEMACRLVAPERTRVRFVADDGPVLPFPRAAFEVAYASCVFHHIAPPQRASWLAEIRRVLTEGGRLFLFEHNPYNPLTRRMVRTCPLDRDAVLLRPGEAATLLGVAGFEIARPQYYFFFPHVLRALRGLEPRLHWLPLGAQYYVTGRRRLG